MNIAAILAGGRGLRMGTDIPKQFIEVEGTPIIMKAALAFQRHPEIDEIYFVCVEERIPYLKELALEYNITKTKAVLPGGSDRRESSFKAVKAVYDTHSPDDVILIHDAARPNVDARIISDNIRLAGKFGACDTVIPSQDTVIISEDGKLADSYTDRRQMYLVQTPQSFRLQEIYDAHLACAGREGITDDCGMVHMCGGKVALAMGSKENVKVTTAEDLKYLGK